MGTESESRFQQKDAMSFSCANFCIKCDPDSSKYVTGIWNWKKHHLLEMNCSYLSLSEKVKNIVTWRNGPHKHRCHVALVHTIRRGWRSCDSQSPRRGWRKRWKEEIESMGGKKYKEYIFLIKHNFLIKQYIGIKVRTHVKFVNNWRIQ